MAHRKILLKQNNNPPPPKDKLISSPSKDTHLIKTKHQRIVDRACSLLFQKGYHLTTIREIARTSDMSMGQLYHYISTKDDILYLVHKHMQQLLYKHLEKSGVTKMENPLAELVTALLYTLEFISKNKKLIQFVYTESKYLGKKHLRAILEMDDKNVVGFWRGILKDINKNNPMKGDLNFNANLIAYLMVFFALRGWNLKDRSKKDNFILLTDFILRGLGIKK